jgi:hypothetical protein
MWRASGFVDFGADQPDRRTSARSSLSLLPFCSLLTLFQRQDCYGENWMETKDSLDLTIFRRSSRSGCDYYRPACRRPSSALSIVSKTVSKSPGWLSFTLLKRRRRFNAREALALRRAGERRCFAALFSA